jgi:hypothetical protein
MLCDVRFFVNLNALRPCMISISLTNSSEVRLHNKPSCKVIEGNYVDSDVRRITAVNRQGRKRGLVNVISNSLYRDDGKKLFAC